MSTMQRYLEHLVEDIRESAKKKDQNVRFNVPKSLLNIPEEFAHLPMVPEQKAYEWFRLSLEMFPAAEKWDEKQLLYLCILIRYLFEHYNIQVELPNVLPYETVYAYLMKALDTYTTCEQNNVNIISFCTDEGANCPFGAYCAHDEKYGCDTWVNGHHWDGYLEWEEMKKNVDHQ